MNKLSSKKQETLEQKMASSDLWIICLTMGIVYIIYLFSSKELREITKNTDIPALLRLFVSAVAQYGIAGLGITIVLIRRKENLSSYGFIKENAVSTIIITVLCYVPKIIYIIATGQYEGYHPLSILVTKDILNSGFPSNVIGMVIIALVWGFFEGFNYAVISRKLNENYPQKGMWLDVGAIVCALICILVHPFNTSLLGIIDIIVNFIAIYGMLVTYRKTRNVWGIIFVFLFLWNAI